MINILSDLEIEKIKDNLLERLKEVFIYRTCGHFITFTEYDVIDLFKDVKCAYLLKFGKQEKNKTEKELNDFSDYDTAVALINLEEEVNDFKYSNKRNPDENNYYLKYICKICENIIAHINEDKELLMVDVKNIPSSLLFVKYQK